MREGATQRAAEPPGLRGLWIFVGLTLLGLAGASLAVLAGLGEGRPPPFLERDARSPVPSPPAPEPDTLHLAGSGTNLPLTRHLAAAFRARHAAPRVVVHESIGSGGGVRAAADGAVSLGLVSRPLSAAEARRGLRVIPYARVAVVLAAHPGVPAPGLTARGLLDLYRGGRPRWPDGRPVRVIQRERGDSSHRAVARALPAFAAVDRRARRARRWRVVYSDSAMREALLATPGGVGLFDLGAILAQRLPLQVIAYHGRRPTAADPVPTGYPFRKDLAFVSRTPVAAAAQRFLRWVASAEGAATIRRHGYVPLDGGRP